jgi:hypothetical protein
LTFAAPGGATMARRGAGNATMTRCSIMDRRHDLGAVVSLRDFEHGACSLPNGSERPGGVGSGRVSARIGAVLANAESRLLARSAGGLPREVVGSERADGFLRLSAAAARQGARARRSLTDRLRRRACPMLVRGSGGLAPRSARDDADRDRVPSDKSDGRPTEPAAADAVGAPVARDARFSIAGGS